jgi:hypothetical protein
MNHLNKIIVLTTACTIYQASATAQNNEDHSRVWLNTPWEVRYLLYVTVEERQKEWQLLAKEKNANDGKKGKHHVYLDAMALFKKSAVFATPNASNIATTLITFDHQGRVTSDAALLGLTGKRTALDYLVLMRDSAPTEKPYSLLHWSQGVPGNMTFGPGPCTMLDILRYEDDWRSGRYPGDFGCREWTAQLFNDERPYIDVTTYTKRGNFIGEFVGWSRFEDAPKPVIGMNGKTWFCLHECPAGEQPGSINDIQAWARKHNYPVPVPPPYQPEYPDKNYRDDINELNHD